MKNRRLLIIGMDGFTWSVGQRLIRDGFMPTLGSLVEKGTYGNLSSVMPFETGPAWASFQTGCRPNNTGIFSFHTHDSAAHSIRLNSYRDIQVPTLLEMLDHYGKKTLCINMPLTSPPPKINGVVIPGLLCPELSSETVHPAWAYDQVVRPRNHYHIVNNKQCDSAAAFVKQSCEAEETRCEVALELMDRESWDVVYFQIQSTDLLQHRYWWAMDRGANGYNDSDFRTAAAFYQTCDTILAQLINRAGPETDVLIVSDHGFTKQRFTLSLNRWFVEHNYLVLKNKDETPWERTKKKHKTLEYFARGFGKMRNTIFRLTRTFRENYLRKSALPFSETELIHLRQSIDLNRSTAFCLGGMGAMIYLNPDVPDKTSVISKIRKELLDEFGPSSKTPLLQDVKTGFDEYGVSLSGVHLPDLVAEYSKGVSNVINPRSGSIVVSYENTKKQSGTHDRSGIFVFQGGNIKSGFQTNAEIVDIVPTLMAYLGLPIPSQLDGKVLESLFVSKPTIHYNNFSRKQTKRIDYTETEQTEVEKRLADLGYL